MNRKVTLIVCAAALLALMPTAAHAQWVWTPQTGRFIDVDKLPKETPELQVQYERQLLTEKRYRKALRETNKFENFYGDSDFADENQFLRGEIREAQGDYLKAAKEYQQVVANYPSTDLFKKVIQKQYEIGGKFYVKKQKKKWAFFRKRPFKRAIDVYTMVIDNQPFTDAAAQARYKIGLCHLTRKEYIEAALDYRRVIEDYPNSDWVDDASYDLAQTYYKSSLPPEYDQAPSQLAIDAVNDFEARFPKDKRAGELNKIKNEMQENIAQQRLETAQFYEKRRQFEAALISYQVVVDQFKGTKAAKVAQTWLDKNAAAIRSKSHLPKKAPPGVPS